MNDESNNKYRSESAALDLADDTECCVAALILLL